jgi:hypothetical protein
MANESQQRLGKVRENLREKSRIEKSRETGDIGYKTENEHKQNKHKLK